MNVTQDQCLGWKEGRLDGEMKLGLGVLALKPQIPCWGVWTPLYGQWGRGKDRFKLLEEEGHNLLMLWAEVRNRRDKGKEGNQESTVYIRLEMMKFRTRAALVNCVHQETAL